jgi:hypothetical protein
MMSETIVNPWVVYLIMESSTICGVLLVLSLSIIPIMIQAIGKNNYNWGTFRLQLKRHPEELKSTSELKFKLNALFFYTVIILSIMVVIACIFMPSRETLIALYINQFITPENVDKALEIFSSFK